MIQPNDLQKTERGKIQISFKNFRVFFFLKKICLKSLRQKKRAGGAAMQNFFTIFALALSQELVHGFSPNFDFF